MLHKLNMIAHHTAIVAISKFTINENEPRHGTLWYTSALFSVIRKRNELKTERSSVHTFMTSETCKFPVENEHDKTI